MKTLGLQAAVLVYVEFQLLYKSFAVFLLLVN